MKKILFLVTCLLSLSLSAQEDRSFGITAGINEYYAKPSIASAKSGTGFSIGLLQGFEITKKSDLVFEANFISFNMQFFGKDIRKSTPEWIDFHSNRIGLSALYYYDVLHFDDNNLVVGIHAGPSVTYINNFTAKGDTNPNYEVGPYGIAGLYMKISKYQKGSPFNTFAAAGLNVQYKAIEMNLRYHLAISSPYRNLKFYDIREQPSGKDDYLSLTFNYYIDL